MDSDSDSSLSSAPEEEVQKLAPIFVKAKKATKLVAPPPKTEPPRPKREPSPPHEDVLADNPDIAFIVMFRSRFQQAFPGKTPHFGPQDIERGVVDTVPTPEIQSLLCALLGLVLNRKKPVERGHHGRALEEAVLSHKAQWPAKWAGKNPLHGGNTFENMTPVDRLNLLRTLIMWSLGSSEIVSAMIKDRYKQQRHNDDENQPLSVQPWGLDTDKRRYFLVQGLDDTNFRVYREGSRWTRNAHWYSMAGSIDEVKALADKLDKVDGSQAARRLANKMTNAIPTFEATEEKRRRREYRQQRRAAFSRPEPGFGIYEGRTRGKRMRYTYEDDDDGSASDATSTRRSTRHQSGRSTPFDAGPTYTASGRQIKQPRQGDYGESLLSNQVMSTDELDPDHDDSDVVRPGGRSTRFGGARPSANGASNPHKRKHIDGYNDIDEMSDEEDAADSADEWNSDQNEADRDEDMPDADDDDSAASEEGDDEPRSLIVKLKVPKYALTNFKDTPPTSPPSPGEDKLSHPIVHASKSESGLDEATKAGATKVEASESLQSNGNVDAESMSLPPPTSTAPTSTSEPQVIISKTEQTHVVPPQSAYLNGTIGSTSGDTSVAPAPPSLNGVTTFNT